MSPASSRNWLVPEELSRSHQLARLRSDIFDVAIVGAGINGAAIARDAAMRGLRVALVDRGDFAGATSSHSSKLIHGGLRYLPQGQLRLVREALRERERLRRVTAPHLVHPIRFLFPCYRGHKPGRFALWAGLVVYDLLARTPSSQRHRRLSASDLREHEPALAMNGLAGGALYYDCWGDDARITWENAFDAAIHGAAILNYCRIEGFSRTGSRITAASGRDLIRGETFELRAQSFVNATGPWLDDLRRIDQPDAISSVRLTKGVHLIVNAQRLQVRDSLVLGGGTNRIVFVMPHDGWVMIGTTDTDFDGGREDLRADASDIEYLIGIVNAALPAADLTAADVAYSFAGLRVLEKAGDGRPPSSVSREEIVLESEPGLISIAGGKLTTHRAIAEKLVDGLMRRLGRPPGQCPTRAIPLPGARGRLDRSSGNSIVSDDVAQMLANRYGTRASMVTAIALDHAALADRIVPGAPAIRAEVIHAIRAEFATSVSDFLVRRTSMVWRDPVSAIAAAPEVARLMGAERGWDSARIRAATELFFLEQPLRATRAVPVTRSNLGGTREKGDERISIR